MDGSPCPKTFPVPTLLAQVQCSQAPGKVVNTLSQTGPLKSWSWVDGVCASACVCVHVCAHVCMHSGTCVSMRYYLP